MYFINNLCVAYLRCADKSGLDPDTEVPFGNGEPVVRCARSASLGQSVYSNMRLFSACLSRALVGFEPACRSTSGARVAETEKPRTLAVRSGRRAHYFKFKARVQTCAIRWQAPHPTRGDDVGVKKQANKQTKTVGVSFVCTK